MGQGQLSEIAQALKGINSALRVIPFGSAQIGLGLETREVKLGWIRTQDTFFGEFWSNDVPSGKLLTRNSDVVLQVARAWLLSESNLAELNRFYAEFIPTEEGLAFERGNLREVRWSNLAKIAPPKMKDFVVQALSQPQLGNAYPLFRLNRLALLTTPGMSGEIASVRRTDSDGYEVLDSSGQSVGLGDAQWAITTLSNLVSQKFHC